MAVASLLWIVPPTTTPGGKPVTELPALTPRLPLTTDGPVLVTVDPPRTPKLPTVDPSVTCAAAGIAETRSSMTVANAMRVDALRSFAAFMVDSLSLRRTAWDSKYGGGGKSDCVLINKQ